jgi:predicted dehydrogenase
MIRAALVGYGLAGKVFHAPLIGATAGLELACVVSSDPGKVRADIPDALVVADLDAVLRDETIALVVLATPDHVHVQQALAALDAGKHVVIDKPFAPSLAEAERVAQRAVAQNRLLSIFHNRRWDADFLTLKRLITDGELGEIVQFESHFDRLRAAGAGRWKDHRDGGLWQDLGPHLIDQALQLFGLPEAVYADLGTFRKNGAAPDYAHALLRYPQTRVILHMTQNIHAHSLRFAAHGERASYLKHGLDPQEDQSKAGVTPADPLWGFDLQPGYLVRVAADGALVERALPSERGAYPAYYARIRDALLGRSRNPVSSAEALDVMRVLEAGILSSQERREINIF